MKDELLTDAQVEDWSRIPEEAFYRHFDATGLRYDEEIGIEAGRLLALGLEFDRIETGSPIDCVISSACTRAAHGAFVAVADALGVDVSDLKCAVAHWYEDRKDGDEMPKSIGFDGLQVLVQEIKDQFA